MKEIIYTILLFGFAQGVIFNLYSLLTSNYRTKSYLYINLWVFFLSLNNIQAWLNERNYLFNNKYFDHLHSPWYIFLAPMFYLFLTRYLQYQRNKWIVIIPLLFFVSSIIVKSVFLLPYKPTDLIGLASLHHQYNSIEEPIGFVITISIFIYSYIIYRKVDKTYLIRSYESLEWIHYFFIFSVVGLLIWFLGVFHKMLYNNNFTDVYYGILRLVTSFILYWIAYKSTLQQRLFDERTAIRKKQKTNLAPNIDSTTLTDEFKEIDNSIICQQLFTDPLLSIETLAEKLDLSVSKLSKLIKTNTGQNFSEYINKFRVEKAKELLLHPEFTNYTILSIGLESGFNSKSVFYSVFKKQTQQTPVEWKETQTENLS